MGLSREEILSFQDVSIVPGQGPGWAEQVFLRSLKAKERDHFELTAAGKSFENIRARLLVLCICDAEGCRLFADEDAEVLGDKSALVLDALFVQARRMNGLTEKDVEDIEKNSVSAPGNGSITG